MLRTSVTVLYYFYSYFLYTNTRVFTVATSGFPDGWFHLVVMYHGEGKGMEIYYDGIEFGLNSVAYGNRVSSSGHIVLGRLYTNRNDGYASVMVDELTLWDH